MAERSNCPPAQGMRQGVLAASARSLASTRIRGWFLSKKGGLALQCDKNDYRGILAGLEGVSGKKAVDSETMTVKN